MSAPAALLAAWLERKLPAPAWQWLAERRDGLRDAYTDRALHITLGLIPRRVGKQDLALEDTELARARAAREGWDPRRWSVADAARVLVLLDTADAGNQGFCERFTDLCRSADVGELIAFYRGLPLYDGAAQLEDQAAEGLRTNMRSVFEAVAHNSPFPGEQFSRARWNQMVLKALFIGSRLAPIQGLDEHANAELAHILCDYAHERWAAQRPVSPELWRCVGPFAEGAMVDDLARVLDGNDEAGQHAAALALSASPDPAAAPVLAKRPELVAKMRDKTIDWDRLQGPPA